MKGSLRLGRHLYEGLQGYLFLSPALILLIVFVAGPGVWVVGLSLTNWDLISSTASFLGVGNYDTLIHDPIWWQTFLQTVYYVVVTVPVGMLLGLGLALLLNRRFPLRGLFRAAIFVPYVTPAVATLVIWQVIFNTDYGLLNALVVHLCLPTTARCLPKLGWLTDSHWAMPAVIIYSLWATVGFNMVIFLAGLANVPPELGEAAHVDGASRIGVFRHVTWPLLTPTTFFVLIISTVAAFKVFDAVYVLTGGSGGPDRSVFVIGFYLYQQAFVYFHAGYASAISVVLFAIVVSLAAVQMRLAGRRVFYR
ncbi:MAG TPA: sugar ABC transporter permease [Candidatus Dormibacteraeota bacterium]|jgi:ABC-type sugar transport system permease subunit|nr:sugar ABC transporter permease [Candidatus Dormibacteraeota bacterium]